MNVDTYTDVWSINPTLKSDLRKRLVINGFKEDVGYKIVGIKKVDPLDTEPPEIGETIRIDYSFKPYNGGGWGYEHLCLMIGRLETRGHNFVKYFKNTKSLADYLDNFELVLDKDRAILRIAKLEKEIKELKINYEL